jgi:hypothetical protein
MFIVKTSGRAFAIALLPLIALHVLLFANGLAEQATRQVALPPPDRALGMLALRVALDAAGIVVGHVLARSSGIGSRAAYALIGGLAAALGYALALRHGLALLPAIEGTTITAGVLPTVVGMCAGFLYGQFAGRELMASANAKITSSAAPTAPAASEPIPASAPLPASFDGPIQVRTSFGAIFLASLTPTLLITLIYMNGILPMIGSQSTSSGPLHFGSQQVMAFGFSIQLFLMSVMMTVLPCTVFVAVAHAIARGLNRTSGLHYAGVGALVGLACGIPLIPLGPVALAALPLAALGAILMAVYRCFAGLEPRPLPEPVLARDAEALVPDDHPSRRTRAVILNG